MEFALFLEAFHFLRPWALILLPCIAATWWLLRDRRSTAPSVATDALAPHLRDALTLKGREGRRLQPIDTVCATLAFAALGAAGPTWSRVPDPFMAQTAPLIVVLEVSASMDAEDVAPSRLERGKQKIRDLLDLRAGAQTALVAYGGSAHRVVPLTEDAAIMRPYLEGLTSAIMPKDGANAEAALEIAQTVLQTQDAVGGVLFVLDGVSSGDAALLDAASDVSVAVLAILPEGQNDPGLDTLARVPVVRVTADSRDIRQVDRDLDAAYRRATLEDDSQQWKDQGRWLAIPAAALVLVWFRRGWTMKWAALLGIALNALVSSPGHAIGLVDLFLTPDQQGQLAIQRNQFGDAAERFTDPLWKGYAYFRSARYPEALDALSGLETADAHFIRALSLIRNRQYREGVRAFETVLALDPSYPGARENLETAKEIVRYVETAQAQSDTGEDTGIGADETVFDNESGVGQETQVDGEDELQVLSTDQWMNSVNTQTSDFLRQRFLLEAKDRQ